MDLSSDRIDEAVLALLCFGPHARRRTRRMFDRDVAPTGDLLVDGLPHPAPQADLGAAAPVNVGKAQAVMLPY